LNQEMRDGASLLIVRVNEAFENALRFLQAGCREEALRLVDGDGGLLGCLGDLAALQRLLDNVPSDAGSVPRRVLPRLRTDLAHALITARDVHLRLAPLLRAHRLLALGGGAIDVRVATLRKLLDVDPDNRGWIADLREYEKEFRGKLLGELVELVETIGKGVSIHQLERAKDIVSKLGESAWQQPLTGREIRSVQRTLDRLREAWARTELQNLASGVATEAGGDLTRARLAQVQSQWELLKAEWPTIGRDPSASTIVHWLDRTQEAIRAAEIRDAEEAVTREIRAALRDPPSAFRGRPEDEWRYLTQLLLRLGSVQRQDSESAAINALRQDAVRHQGKLATTIIARRLTVGGVLMLAVVFLAAGGWLAVLRIRSTRASDRVISMMERALEEHGPCHAARVWAEQTARFPRLKDHPFAVHLKETLDKADRDARRIESECRERSDVVRERLATVRSRDMQAIVPVTSDPPLVSQSLSCFRKVKRELDSLDRTLIEIDEDVKTLRRLVGDQAAEVSAAKVRDLHAEVASTVDVLMKAEGDVRALVLVEVEKLLETVTSGPTNSDQSAAKLAAAQALLDSGEVLLGRQAVNLKSRLKGLLDREGRARCADIIHVRLRGQSESGVDAYVTELLSQQDKLAEYLADDTFAFNKIAEMTPAYLAVEAWSSVASRWTPLQKRSRVEAAALAAAITGAMRSPVRPANYSDGQTRLSRLVAYLEQQASGPPKEFANLEEYLERPIMRQGVQVAVHDGRNYYVTVGTGIQYFIDEGKTQPLSATTEFLRTGPKYVAPHVEWARAIRGLLSAVEKSDSDADDALAASIALVGFTDKATAEVDPVLRCRVMMALLGVARTRVLFEQVAPVIVARSEAMRQELGRYPAWVRSAGVTDRTAWQTSRERARQVLPARADVERLAAEPTAYAALLEKRPPYCRPLEFFGWIDVQGTEYRVRSFAVGNNAMTGTLLTVRLDGGDAWMLVPIGEVRDGAISDGEAEGCFFGEPVWLDTELQGGAPMD
jgi:hypothetical protein